MKAPYSGEPGTDWLLSKESGSFYGPPNECRGELKLINTSDSKIKVRSLNTQTVSRTRKDCASLPPSIINLFARVAPNSESSVMAELHVPRDTKPGQYQAAVVYGKQKHPLEITIAEHHETLISPNHLRVKASSGDTVNCQVTISNLGNVPIELGDVGMVWLREHNWIGRTLVYSLREAEESEKFTDFTDRAFQNLKQSLIPPARIQFSPEKLDALPAGQSLLRKGSLTLPYGLMKGRRYSGFIKINESRIWLEVFCTGSQKSTTT